MKTLGIHTGGLGCSVALMDGERFVYAICCDASRSQAELLMPTVSEVLSRAGIALNAVDRFGVTVGPGSFTGLRIGLAAIGGMMLATGNPCVGVTSFEAVEHAVPDGPTEGGTLLVVLESKRAELFVQPFDASRAALAGPEALLAEQVAERYGARPLTLVGDGAVRLKPALLGRPQVHFYEISEPEAVAVAQLAARREPSALPPRPLYLRPADVTV